jgi:hypothetical protein
MNLQQDNPFPQRQNPSSGVHVQLGQSNIVLLTISAENRTPWLANETAHQFLRQTWSEATAWLVGDYLLMPDHLHFFARRGICISQLRNGAAIGNDNSAASIETKIGNFSRVAGIIGCVMEKIISRSGFMFRRIRFAKAWFRGLRTGHSKAGCLI